MIERARRCLGRRAGRAASLAAGWIALLSLACEANPAGPGAVIVFSIEPQDGQAGQVLAPVAVSLRNAFGEPAAGQVTLSLFESRCGSRLSGTLIRSAVGGSVTFDDLVIDAPQDDYRLVATIGPDAALSVPFNVTGGASASLRLATTICNKPNDQRDAESLAYVATDDAFWIGDDDLPSIYQVSRVTGAYLSRIDSAAFVAALPGVDQCDDGDGDPATTCSYLGELETLTYDPTTSYMYVINTVNDPNLQPPVDKPAIYRLRKNGCGGCLAFDSWQPLPAGTSYGAAVAFEGRIYLAVDRHLYEYDFATNRVLSVDQNGDSLPPALSITRRIIGLTYDAGALWVMSSGEIRKIDWASRTEVRSHDLTPFGIPRPRGIEAIGGTIYIVDGNFPHRIYVFVETGT